MTKNSKRTNTDNKITELGTILHRKLKIEQCEPHNETMVELGYFGRVGISFSTSVTRRVTLVTNPVIIMNEEMTRL